MTISPHKHTTQRAHTYTSARVTFRTRTAIGTQQRFQDVPNNCLNFVDLWFHYGGDGVCHCFQACFQISLDRADFLVGFGCSSRECVFDVGVDFGDFFIQSLFLSVQSFVDVSGDSCELVINTRFGCFEDGCYKVKLSVYGADGSRATCSARITVRGKRERAGEGRKRKKEGEK